jgi:cytidylate kinase
VIVAIDGPAGSGKTTIGRMVAAALGCALVDTGLLYRAVTVEAQRRSIPPDDDVRLAAMVRRLLIDIDTSAQSPRASLVSVDGHDVTAEAFDPAIARDLATVSQQALVREALVDRQRAYGYANAVVLGRDIGTVIFPNAEHKFFLTASVAERSARRRRDLERVAHEAPSDSVLTDEVEARDRADTERQVAPLRPAPDAIIISTEGKSVAQVFDEVMSRLRPGR